MVWFYRKKISDLLNFLFGFQSHYGLILSNWKPSISPPLICSFNPTMVWFYPSSRCRSRTLLLKLSIPLWSDFIFIAATAALERLIVFQSHYGLILSGIRCYRSCMTGNIFQSHYGLILSNWFLEGDSCNFSSFQSHYGLILSQGRPNYDNWRFRNTIFQSHYGLILSLFSPLLIIWSIRPFNPTMVWFYHGGKELVEISEHLLSIPLWSDFIGGVKVVANDPGNAFNPTMVWFYRFSVLEVFEVGKHLSIPLWSDFIPNSEYTVRRLCVQLSIPLWSDFILWERRWQRLSSPLLSIPLWSDFIYNDLSRGKRRDKTFNPTMVWFYRDFSELKEADRALSIPLWSDFIRFI